MIVRVVVRWGGGVGMVLVDGPLDAFTAPWFAPMDMTRDALAKWDSTHWSPERESTLICSE